MSVKIPEFELNFKAVGIILLIGAIVFLGIRSFRLSRTVKALNTNQGFILQTLVDEGIVKIKRQPTVQSQAPAQKAPEAVKEGEKK